MKEIYGEPFPEPRITVRIMGQLCQCLLDTGANINAISPTMVQQLGIITTIESHPIRTVAGIQWATATANIMVEISEAQHTWRFSVLENRSGIILGRAAIARAGLFISPEMRVFRFHHFTEHGSTLYPMWVRWPANVRIRKVPEANESPSLGESESWSGDTSLDEYLGNEPSSVEEAGLNNPPAEQNFPEWGNEPSFRSESTNPEQQISLPKPKNRDRSRKHRIVVDPTPPYKH